jgi:hypothetical protein
MYNDDVPIILPLEEKEDPLLYRRIASFIGMIMMIVALIMVCVWATKGDQEKGYLGGLNWNDKVRPPRK